MSGLHASTQNHKKRHEKKSLRENDVVSNSVMGFQIHPGLNYMAHARQVHRGLFVSEYVQLATTKSVTFRVTNSSVYVTRAICEVYVQTRVRHYEGHAPVCSQLQGLRRGQ